MKNFLLWLILAILIGGGFYLSFFNKTEPASQITSMLEEKNKNGEKIIRRPAVAGQFYPADKKELSEIVSQFLEKVEIDRPTQPIVALIVPHAGYVFSGPVAASGFKAVAEQDIRRIILIGSSHQHYLTGAVIDGSDAWQTPLGQVDLDIDLREKLTGESSLFKIDSMPHQAEHSLEVEIPFLQTVLKDFKLLPILVSQLTDGDLEKISQSLIKYFDEKTLLVISSDMSHYPDYQKANYADKKVIEAILTGQISTLRQTISQLEKENIPNLATCLCAQSAVEVALKIASEIKADQIKLLEYANSGDADLGDKKQVVGYGAISFSGNVSNSRAYLSTTPLQEKSMESQGASLNNDQKQTLLEIAKESVEKYILEKETAEFEITDSVLNQPLGAFVTLKNRGRLRGCIGQFILPVEITGRDEETETPLYQIVSQMAVAAAARDNRFLPVEPDELPDLEYEISVLSPLRKINSWQEIELGRHGVWVKQGSRSGVFLPQVALENNWTLEEFMDNLCQHKAGLPADIWKTGQAELYVFTAEVFSD